MSNSPEERIAAQKALRHTPRTWVEPSNPEHEMVVARAALRMAAMIILGELTIPDWVQRTLPKSLTMQEIVDYCISRIRMEMHAEWDEREVAEYRRAIERSNHE
jgi:hypothetical protein